MPSTLGLLPNRRILIVYLGCRFRPGPSKDPELTACSEWSALPLGATVLASVPN